MKISEVRALNNDEMSRKVDELKQELFNLRFQHGTGQIENPIKMRLTKRDIAKIKTIIRQTELRKA